MQRRRDPPIALAALMQPSTLTAPMQPTALAAQHPAAAAMQRPDPARVDAARALARSLMPAHQSIVSGDGAEKFLIQYFTVSRLSFIGLWRDHFQDIADLQPVPGDPPSLGPGEDRVMFHLDMDAFFASVATCGRPALAGLPVAVAWKRDGGAGGAGAGWGGEVSSCNYEARKWGLYASMSVNAALEKCPDLTIVPYDFEAYARAGEAMYVRLFARCLAVAASSLRAAACCPPPPSSRMAPHCRRLAHPLTH